MPGANKYAVKVGNRFALGSAESGSDSGSEDELQNVDPFAMIKKAEVDAVRKVKNDIKLKKGFTAIEHYGHVLNITDEK